MKPFIEACQEALAARTAAKAANDPDAVKRAEERLAKLLRNAGKGTRASREAAVLGERHQKNADDLPVERLSNAAETVG